MGRLDPWELFFSSAGRIDRRAYASTALILLLISLGWRLLTPQAWPWWTGLIVYAPALFSLGCLTSKRLHDRGRTGWWGLLIIPALMVLWVRAEAPLGGSAAAVISTGIAAVILLVWAAETLVFSNRGEFNRYGPPPGGI